MEDRGQPNLYSTSVTLLAGWVFSLFAVQSLSHVRLFATPWTAA